MPAVTSLAGRVAVVTGASRGLGRAMALALAEAGADVALAGRSTADLEDTARRVEAVGRRAIVVPTDVGVYRQVERLVERSIGELGGLDIVVNNSGIAQVTPLAEMPPEEFEETLRVNLVGVFNGCRAAAAHLIAQKAGKVINIASVLGAGRPSGLHGLRSLQGWCHGPDAGAGGGVGSAQHPGQRAGARMVRHRHERAGIR